MLALPGGLGEMVDGASVAITRGEAAGHSDAGDEKAASRERREATAQELASPTESIIV